MTTHTTEANGLDAVALHRLARKLHNLGIPLAPRLIDYAIFFLLTPSSITQLLSAPALDVAIAV